MAVRPYLSLLSNEGDQTVVRALGAIPVEDYDALTLATKDLNAFTRRDTFEYVKTNFLTYSQYCSTVEADLDKTVKLTALLQIAGRNIMTYFVNWLCSARLYLEQTEIQLQRRYGRHSPELKAYKTATSDEYDQYFTYRFFYRLRNYVWHSGLDGIGGSAVTATRPDEGDFVHKLSTYCDRDVLLASFDSWGRVKEELKSMPDRLELRPMVDEMMGCLGRICTAVLEIDRPALEKQLATVRRFRNAVPGYQGPLYAMYLPEDTKDDEDLQELEFNCVSVPALPAKLEDYVTPNTAVFESPRVQIKESEWSVDENHQGPVIFNISVKTVEAARPDRTAKNDFEIDDTVVEGPSNLTASGAIASGPRIVTFCEVKLGRLEGQEFVELRLSTVQNAEGALYLLSLRGAIELFRGALELWERASSKSATEDVILSGGPANGRRAQVDPGAATVSFSYFRSSATSPDRSGRPLPAFLYKPYDSTDPNLQSDDPL